MSTESGIPDFRRKAGELAGWSHRAHVSERGQAAVSWSGRMCQKAFGGFYGPLVGAPGLRWTRGEPRRFRSSNSVRRGFCEDCGTPLTFEPDGGSVDVAIGALDDPALAQPVIQLARASRLIWVDDLASLPWGWEAVETAEHAKIVSRQHPSDRCSRVRAGRQPRSARPRTGSPR